MASVTGWLASLSKGWPLGRSEAEVCLVPLFSPPLCGDDMTGSASLDSGSADFFPARPQILHSSPDPGEHTGRQQAPQPLRAKERVPALHLPAHPVLASDLTTCLGIFIAAHGGTEAG